MKSIDLFAGPGGWDEGVRALGLAPLGVELDKDACATRCEQVPAVLPLWRRYAEELRQLGYSTWAGVLNAADYGVPQTRERAILLAEWEGAVLPPPPTHAKEPGESLFDQRLPWVSMKDALGWDGLVGFPRRADGQETVELDGELYRARDLRSTKEPAQAVTEKARGWTLRPGGG